MSNRQVPITPWSGNLDNSGYVMVAGHPESHLNLYLSYGNKFICACMKREDALELRKELNEFFADERAEEKFIVLPHWDGRYNILKETLKLSSEPFASTETRADAERIVAAIKKV